MPCTFVSLKDNVFQKALDRYIDEEKPDPLMTKQMQAWSFHWTDDHNDKGDDDAAQSFEKHISGRLLWRGEFVEITIQCQCWWEGQEQGSLYFCCHILKTSFREAEGSDKTVQKVHRRMIKRLETDDYISKYLLKETNELCQATIRVSDASLEERVHCSEQVAEAIRRAIFSTAESTLDVFDLFLHLPCLPCTVHSDDVTETTALANRAKLRLLEDATYDACEKEEEEEKEEEKEEEEELVKHLKIDPRKKQKAII